MDFFKVLPFIFTTVSVFDQFVITKAGLIKGEFLLASIDSDNGFKLSDELLLIT